jgi:CRP-like cAMP-binding protein
VSNALIRKIGRFTQLSEGDNQALEHLCERRRHVDAYQEIVSEGTVRDVVYAVLEGFACRYKILGEGQRSILAYLVPGDMCDWQIFVLGKMDHSIATLSACEIVEIPRKAMLEVTDKHPAITRALWWATLVDEAILREWIVNVARRSADQAVAHLFCEILLRLEVVGLRIGNGFEFPVTQTDLADTVGLSSVHANRVLQNLRRKKLIRLTKKSLQILDVQGLMDLAGFEPNYLHLRRDENMVFKNGAQSPAPSNRDRQR